MQIEITTYQAIELHGVLSLLETIGLDEMPEKIRLQLIRAAAASPEIKNIEGLLKEKLDAIAVKQKASIGALGASIAVSSRDAWDGEEKLEPLNITAPPDWNQYDNYLFAGGKAEYEKWKTFSIEFRSSFAQ